jgi:hypothetical protein
MRIVSSTEVPSKNCAILLWGPAASRKTEAALRHFPHPLVLDVEGKAHHAIGVEGVNEFLMVQTKDVYEILTVLDDLAEGKIKFPDGSPVETVSIDSASVLWSVRQEAGALMAEKRAKKYAGRNSSVDPDTVMMTMMDWNKVKRPLKRLMTKLNNSPIKYFIITAREKPLYEEIKQGGKTELQRIGETPDLQRGVEYEVDVSFRFLPGDPWKCRVTRTRGLLESIMPFGTEFEEFPHQTLIDYATGEGIQQQDELAVAEAQVEQDRTKTREDLIDFGKDAGLTAEEIAEALKKKKLRFNAAKWDKMVEAVTDFAEKKEGA